MITLRGALRLLCAGVLAAACVGAWSDEAAIRKAWAERNPKSRSIDEITATPIPGLYELRVGVDIFYSDDKGNYLLRPSHDNADGHLVDTRTNADLTSERISQLMARDVPKLPYKDAIVLKQGSGARRVVVFEDPYCGYCKDLERNLVQLKDVTIYTFLIPILSQESAKRSRDIWCARDNALAWRSWMLDGVAPLRNLGQCDSSVLARNLALASRYHVNATPAILFDDGSRFSGAVDLDRLQARLNEASGRKG